MRKMLISFLLVLLCPTAVFPTVNYMVNRPEDVPKARQEIQDKLVRKYFDDLRQCCQSVNPGGQAPAALDCDALADPNSPTKSLTLSGQNSVVKQFYYKCMAHSRDSRKCCAQRGVSDDCLPLCNAASPPADDAIEAALVKCQEHKSAISKCFHWSMESAKDEGQMHFADEEQQQQQQQQ